MGAISGYMATACASNFNSILQRDLLMSLESKTHVIDSVSLHGVVKNTFSVPVNRKQRFMSYNSYAMPQFRSAVSSDRSEGGVGNGFFFDFGPSLNFKEVMKKTEARGVSLPLDLSMAAITTGIPDLCLYRYFYLERFNWGLGFAMRSCSMFRNHMMMDPTYLMILGIKFALGVYLDITLARRMNMMGRDYEEIVMFLWFRFFYKAVTKGVIEPHGYAQRIIRHLEGWVHNNRMFVAERSVSLVQGAAFFGHLYCAAALVFTLYVIQLYG